MRSILAAAVLFLAPASTRAQTQDEVRRGEMRVIVHTQGTVVAEDVFRMKSTIDGRVEAVLISSYSWAGPEAPVGLLANTELAALMDTRQTTPQEVLEERWIKVYQPTKVICPTDCFILQAYARPKKWVKPGAALFEAARTLRIVGRIRPEDRHWMAEGLDVEFWPVSRPGFKQHAQVHNFILDVQGQKVDPGGTFTGLLARGRSLNPGTQWEGAITALIKKDVLKARTNALIEHQGALFLPVRVSTGITTTDWTEITAGVDEKRTILILDPADLRGGAEPYFPKVQPMDIPRLPVSQDELERRDPPPKDDEDE